MAFFYMGASYDSAMSFRSRSFRRPALCLGFAWKEEAPRFHLAKNSGTLSLGVPKNQLLCLFFGSPQNGGFSFGFPGKMTNKGYPQNTHPTFLPRNGEATQLPNNLQFPVRSSDSSIHPSFPRLQVPNVISHHGGRLPETPGLPALATHLSREKSLNESTQNESKRFPRFLGRGGGGVLQRLFEALTFRWSPNMEYPAVMPAWDSHPRFTVAVLLAAHNQWHLLCLTTVSVYQLAHPKPQIREPQAKAFVELSKLCAAFYTPAFSRKAARPNGDLWKSKDICTNSF